MNFSYYILVFFIIFLCMQQKKKKRALVRKIINNKKTAINEKKERLKMKELATRFIGKDCFVKLIDDKADGILKEVNDNGIVLENKGRETVINFDYVVKIFEYPYKNGKRATVWSY